MAFLSCYTAIVTILKCMFIYKCIHSPAPLSFQTNQFTIICIALINCYSVVFLKMSVAICSSAVGQEMLVTSFIVGLSGQC